MQALTKSILTWMVVLGATFGLMLAFSPATEVLGQDCPGGTTTIRDGVDCIGDNIDGGDPATLESVIQSVINTMLFLIGIVSVIMLIVGGIRYVVSGGNQTAVESARNTILYAIVGLVIAFVAWGIVNFVINALSENT